MRDDNVTFPHHDAEFEKLLRIVAEKHGLATGLVEKDYWVTHTLWALHAAGFEIWFKGGTSLSKGFGLIRRFSEDLDLRIDPGAMQDLSLPEPWDGRSKGAVQRRAKYFEALAKKIVIPEVEIRPPEIEKNGRFAAYELVYPGTHHKEVVTGGMRPFVLIEAGRARVTPFVERNLSSFVHDTLREQGHEEMLENTPTGVRCLHPLVTLFDKLDAISARFNRSADEGAYARHYEDAAQIILACEELPILEEGPADLATEMFTARDIRVIPSHEDAAFSPVGSRLGALKGACEKIQGMFWGKRLTIEECCEIIRQWIRTTLS